MTMPKINNDARIYTFDAHDRPNGWLLPIWSSLTCSITPPAQVYLISIEPHTTKGPHLHLKRRGLFSVIAGSVLFVTREATFDDAGKIIHHYFPTHRRAFDGQLFFVPPGVPCSLHNPGLTDALVLNMPAPAWSLRDPDDHPVSDWADPFTTNVDLFTK